MKITSLGIEFDLFGDTDPKKMPAHLWGHVRTMDYSTAVRADTAKQNYTVCPRNWYIDAVYRCRDCGEDFVFSVTEQRYWYEQRRFFIESRPVRCVKCRKKEAQLPKKGKK